MNATVMVVTGLILVVAFLYLAWYGLALLFDGGNTVVRGIGAGVVLLVVVGAWSLWAIVRNGIELQRISSAAAAEGIELDTEGLERMPSGRIVRADADRLFETVSREYRQNPGDWRANYRLARAYDHAGDRARARQTMRRALELWSARTDAPAPGDGGPR